MAHDDLIAELAEKLGVAASYQDQNDRRCDIALATRRALIEGLGYSAANEEETRASLARVEAERAGPLPLWIVVEAGRPATIEAQGAIGRWSVRDESGGLVAEGAGAAIALPALEAGYAHLIVEEGARATLLLVAPPRCWSPEAFRAGARGWGVTAQVYGLRSQRDLGFGDFSDVATLSEGAGRAGASFVGLSPLHALFSADRSKISPYSPSTRFFLEALYIDPLAAPGAAALEPLLADAAKEIERLRGAGLLNYWSVWALKAPLLEKLFAAFRSGGDAEAFARRRAEMGEPLEAHATFEALSEHFAAQGLMWPGVWPADYRIAGSQAVSDFRRDKAERVAFHAWLQILADDQLAAASEAGVRAGMEIGLYRDLAVGADRYGSEAWSHPHRYAATLSVGAPPDPLGPQGQDWGFPPFHPQALEREGFAGFRELVVSNMRHAGAIRIDHAFQLARLFLIPEGAGAPGGGYVAFPFEALLAILRIESERRKCLVIAEDLGTGPAGFSDAIMRSGVLSYRILSFEREHDGGFKPPAHYPREALAAITTHDLPTFKGWRLGMDIDIRECFGVYDMARAASEREGRARDLAAWKRALTGETLLSDLTQDQPSRDAALRYLARAPSSLVAVQTEDALDELHQANLPGPLEGYPSWRRRLPAALDDLAGPGGALAKIGALMTQEGRSPRARESRLAAPAPRATYRLQMHEKFGFAQAQAILPYLRDLGVSHVYLSPIQRAAKGSTHGYDVVDPTMINPELGGEAAFLAFSDAARAAGLKLVLDIVPNHMGAGPDNPTWTSVLQWGRASPYAGVYDIDWERAGAGGKLILPVLGKLYGDALADGDLTVGFDAARGLFVVRSYDTPFPIAARDAVPILKAAAARTEFGAHAGARLGDLCEEAAALLDAPDAATRAEAFARTLSAAASDPSIAAALEAAAHDMGEDKERLDALLSRQAYRLAHWRLASSELNYRRFFEINTLAGVRVEDENVFALTHALILRLVREKRLDGLRVDHVDGLADPAAYLARLQDAVGPGFYIVVEKILEPGEALPAWPISGTTGYDALNEIDGLLVNPAAREPFDAFYRDVVGSRGGYQSALHAAKRLVLADSFGSEREAIVADLVAVARADRATRDIGAAALARAVFAYVVALPVYRTYAATGVASAEDRRLIEATLKAAGERVEPGDEPALAFLGRVVAGDDAADRVLALRARLRLEQLTGPVMAKGAEDTAFYRYVPFLALNEVGGDPMRFGLDAAGYAKVATDRAARWPASLIATSTHDTKRGEDARARLFALTADPARWIACAERFIQASEGPDKNDRYLLLQAIVGAFPLDLLDGEPDAQAVEAFQSRLDAFMTKALREAKRRSSWTDADDAYEARARAFLKSAMTPGAETFALARDAAKSAALIGALNGLTRTLIKLTTPGVPDFYQGTEFWDFSLVDPDNRRPVDFAARARSLADVESAPIDSLLPHWRDGRVKQALMRRLLRDRAEHPDLYAYGDIAQRPAGLGLAFERAYRDERLFVYAPSGVAMGGSGFDSPPDGAIFGEEMVTLKPARWRNLLTDATFEAKGATRVSDVAGAAPWLILRAEND